MTCPLFYSHVIKKEKDQHAKISMGFADKLFCITLCL